ncbi:MAG: N-acetylmuramoyl-L-alanine amidase [Epsilonproteobacteria bacterium]|nr:N-acetylmuramoyl-L-alanine amidase [Campylobacterota bacterium]
MLFFLWIVLFAQSSELEKARYYLQSYKKSDILRAHDIYKAQYIKSLLDEKDTRLRIEALKGLIATSKKLGLPYREYQSELYDLIGDSKIASVKKSPPVKRRIQKPKIRQKRLTKIVLRRGYVEFYFDSPLELRDISFKRMRLGGRHKNVYDIKGELTGGTKRYRLKSVDWMRVAQFSKDRIRIVFEDELPITTKKVIKGKKLEIHLKPPSSNAKGNARSSVKSVVKKSASSAAKVPQVLLNERKVIVLDPGHGGRDSGAVGYKGKKEKDIVLAIAKRLYKILKKQGYKVYMTRKGDYFVTLRNRTRFANKMKAHLFISIHANAAPTKKKYLSMKGLETFFLSPSRSERAKRVAEQENRVEVRDMSYFSKQVYLDFLNRERIILSNKLAIDIQRNVLYRVRKRFPLVDGGVRPGPFWVLVGAQMPSVLVEVGYITNPTEAKRLSSPYYQTLIAEGIASGIASYFRNNQR